MKDKKSWLGIGLMSGTSLDGLDIAACRFSQSNDTWQFEIEAAETLPLPFPVKEKIQNVVSGTALDLARLDTELGHLFGLLCDDFISRNALQPDFVASHGQTIFHQPEYGFTCQIGDGETLVSHLPCVLVSNFRRKDVAWGGQGAPLVPFGEKMLFPELSQFLNLGGIANVNLDGQAFDVTLCNISLNTIAAELGHEYDPEGSLARSGNLDFKLLKSIESNEYFSQNPPKSLGKEFFIGFQSHYLQLFKGSKEDILSTLTEHIAKETTRAIREWGDIEKEVLVTGGGAHNRFLMERLMAHGLKPAKIQSEYLVDFKEALIFGFLGLMTLMGKPNVLIQATGASEAAIGGSIHLPSGSHKNRIFSIF